MVRNANRRARLGLVMLAILVPVAGLLTACQAPPRVLIYGDSITVESHGAGEANTILRGYAVDWAGARFMTAPCNGIVLAKKLTYTPDVVVINYSGNHGSYQDNCMNDETGQALVARYTKDVQTLIDWYRNGKTRIVLVGAPARKPVLEDSNLVFYAMQALAAAPANQVAFFDGGRYLTPHRTLTSSVALCLGSETGAKCGTSKDPTRNYIRDSRHDHLCPLGTTVDGRCGMYNSGAVRLTWNFLDGIKAAKVAKT